MNIYNDAPEINNILFVLVRQYDAPYKTVKYLEACCEGIPVHGTKNYIIKSSSINEEETFHGPYAYGILVDEKKNWITYYYIAPD